MRKETVRASLALSFVGVFIAITGSMALFPLFSTKVVDLGEYADFFAKTSSVYTGILGVIIGYYFGKADDRRQTGGSDDAEGKQARKE